MNRKQAFGLVAGLAASYVILNPEKRELDDDARTRQGGTYVKLPGGVTHYELAGPPQGPVVAFLHGGITPLVTWDEYLPELHGAGLQTLRYDLFGRGYSDRPRGVHDRTLFRQQLLDLLDCLNLSEPVDLVGYCIGGAIAADFTTHYPERVGRLALIAPVVHPFSMVPVFRPPILSEFMGRLAAWREAANLATAPWRAGAAGRRRARFLMEQTTYRGYQASVVSMIRGAAAEHYVESYRVIGRQDRPVLLIRGTRDMEITPSAMDEVRDLIPQVEFHAIPNATHDIVFENAEAIRPLLARFLGPAR